MNWKAIAVSTLYFLTFIPVLTFGLMNFKTVWKELNNLYNQKESGDFSSDSVQSGTELYDKIMDIANMKSVWERGINLDIRIGVCGKCGEAIHYRYPCKCRREMKKKVITLCGSTRFKDEFNETNKSLTLEGNVVISVGVFGHAEGIEITEEEKMMLDNIHFQKIDMADEIFVINVNGYIGSSTKREIKYAESQGKPVRYYE